MDCFVLVDSRAARLSLHFFFEGAGYRAFFISRLDPLPLLRTMPAHADYA
jgi:hypothetical protein